MRQRYINDRSVIHYYTDAAVAGRTSVSAFIKKGYFIGTQHKVRKSFRYKTNIEAEKRAIMLVVDDAQQHQYDPNKVVIHTDQKALCFNYIRNQNYCHLRDQLNTAGYHLCYLKSTHQRSNSNSYLIHHLVNTTLHQRPNRYQMHRQQRKARVCE